MIVLIDIGNSRIKLGWLDPATGAREPEPTALDHNSLGDGLHTWLAQLPGTVTHAVGTNVGKAESARQLEAHLLAEGCPVQWHQSADSMLGLHNGYTHPEQLGADRWAAMLGLLGHLPTDHGPALLASFGTATTVDTISPDNTFVGGLILPGPALMLESLARNTANLPLAHADAADYPTDTHQAIVTGVAAAQAGAILRQWLAGLQRYGCAPELHVTGGGWPLVAAEVRRLLNEAAQLHGQTVSILHERDRLVLDGLAALATVR